MTPEQESDGEVEIGEDDELEEDELTATPVRTSLQIIMKELIVQSKPKNTPSANRRAQEASAKKAATAERKAQVAEIGKKRGAIEQARVRRSAYPL